MVLFGVVAVGLSVRRWKGESMVNSSWRASFPGSSKGMNLS